MNPDQPFEHTGAVNDLGTSSSRRTFPKELTTVTTFSKYVALVLFIALPFLGGYVGYVYAPEKVIEVQIASEGSQRVEVVEAEAEDEETGEHIADDAAVVAFPTSTLRYGDLQIVVNDTGLKLFGASTADPEQVIALANVPVTNPPARFSDLYLRGDDWETVQDMQADLLLAPPVLLGYDIDSNGFGDIGILFDWPSPLNYGYLFFVYNEETELYEPARSETENGLVVAYRPRWDHERSQLISIFRPTDPQIDVIERYVYNQTTDSFLVIE